MDDATADAAVLRHCRQFREGIPARSIMIIDPATGDPASAPVTRAAVARLLDDGRLRWKNGRVRNRVVTTRPARSRDDEPVSGDGLW